MKTRSRKRKSRTRRIAKHRARRAGRRKGKMPEGLRRWLEEKRAKANPARGKRRKSRRRSKGSRMKTRRVKHRRRRAKSNPGLLAMLEGKTKRRGRRRSKSHHRRARRARRNPGKVAKFSGALLSGFTHLGAHLKETFLRGGIKGFAAAGLGAGAAVTAGAVVGRGTTLLMAKVAPSLVTHPLFSRVMGAANFYLAGWALARFTPGLSPRLRRGMLTGATVAAIIEGIRPGLVHQQFARLPLVGGFFGTTVPGMADSVGDYVIHALGGLGHSDTTNIDVDAEGSDREAGMGDIVRFDPNTGMTEGVEDYVVGAGA